MPCWLPGTLGVSSYSSHKRTQAKGPKCSLRLLAPSQHHWRGGRRYRAGLGRGRGAVQGRPLVPHGLFQHPLVSVGSGSPVQGAPLSSQTLGYSKPPGVLLPPALCHGQAQLGLGAPGGRHRCEPCPPCSASWGTDPACAGGLGSQPCPGLSSGTQASESQLPPGMSLSAGAVIVGPAWDARASYLGPQEPPILVQSWPESQPQRRDCHSP